MRRERAKTEEVLPTPQGNRMDRLAVVEVVVEEVVLALAVIEEKVRQAEEGMLSKGACSPCVV